MKINGNLERMWVNQPSTLQPDHKLHATNVLAIKSTPRCHTIFFLSGNTVSQEIESRSLSVGWTGK